MTKDNHFLCQFMLEGILPGPRLVPRIEVTLEINADGILNVSIVSKDSAGMLTLTNESDHRLSKEDIDRLVDEAEELKGEEEVAETNVEAKISFEKYCFKMKKKVFNDEKPTE